jgi:hypothetical protein
LYETIPAMPQFNRLATNGKNTMDPEDTPATSLAKYTSEFRQVLARCQARRDIKDRATATFTNPWGLQRFIDRNPFVSA